MRRVIFEANEQGTLEDFNNLGLFPEATFDAIGQGLLIPDGAYWGFPVSAEGTTTIVVGGGNIMVDGKVYVNDDQGGTEFSLLTRLPVAARRYVTLVAWGTEQDESTDPRAFLTNVETRAIEARLVPTARVRRAELALISGIEEPDPSPATPAVGQIAIAHILLDTTGIVDDGGVMMVEENLAPNLRSLWLLAKEFDIWRLRIGLLIDTLASDLAALGGRIRGLAERDLVIGVMMDLAQVKDRVGVPDNYSAWASDHFLDYTNSNIAASGWLSLVQDGARFPYAQERDAQLALLNSLDPNVTVQNEFMLPKYDLVERISVIGRDSEIAISSIEFQTVSTVQKSISRQRVRYGATFNKCTNSQFWLSGEYDPATHLFDRGPGETYTVLAVSKVDRRRHKFVRLQQYWVDTWEDYYWENVVTTTSYGGSVLGQTFLNSQEGWLCAVDLYFTRVASSGDVRVMITETTESGQPNLEAVIGAALLSPSDMHVYPVATRVLLQPTALQMGKRYAVVLMTPGNHYVAMVTGNKFTSGSMFTSTDESWFQGSLLNDIAMQLVFARFQAPRVEVQMQPLQLENGICNIDINVDAVVPPSEGFGIIHEIQQPVTGDWVALGDEPNLLTGLPAMVPYRIVFLGTTEMMPGVGVGSNSRINTWRPRADFMHVSEIRTMPGVSTINTIYLTLRLEFWRGAPTYAIHTCIPKIRYGASPGVFGTLKTGTLTIEQAQDDPDNAVYIKGVFTFSPAIHEYMIEIAGTTSNVVETFHVAERIDAALTI